MNFAFNGVNGATGDYLLPDFTPAELATIAKGEQFDKAQLQELKWRYHQSTPKRHLGLAEGIDPKNLSEAGWGVIFAFEDEQKVPAMKEALSELLQLRKEQSGDLYKEFSGPNAYRPGESKIDFLVRFGAGPGPVVPEKVPYYLLIVGSPAAIPFRFQYQLDVQFAVGRIHFDSLQEYAHYARSVVMAEKGDVKLPRKALFFGVQNQSDRSTELSSKYLVEPLAQTLANEQPEWEISTVLGGDAEKKRLVESVGGRQTPTFLFTASHGMGFPRDDLRQLQHQGALLCQDWPGPKAWKGPIPPDHYLAADDISDSASLLGMISFHFACYGAGTPQMDDFAHSAFKERAEIAPHPFISRLPQRLLGHPRGGALAVIGHIDRAWGYSFQWDKNVAQIEVFRSAVQRLMEDHPVGSALEYFNQRYAELSTQLSTELEEIQFGKISDDLELSGMWTANNDARSYVILGDPAVRLAVNGGVSTEKERPSIQTAFRSSTSIPTSPGASEGPVAEPTSPAIEYDVSNTTDGTLAAVESAVRRFARQLEVMIERGIDEASTLEVKTYVSDNLAQIPDPVETSASLRAVTRIGIDGDTNVIVPDKETEIPKALWSIHLDSVQQAQASRLEMIDATTLAMARLLEALKAK